MLLRLSDWLKAFWKAAGAVTKLFKKPFLNFIKVSDCK
jgi:hypothetical protein